MDLITTLWVGEELPRIPRLCLKSHLDHGFHMQLYVYPHLFKDENKVPAGCEIKNAEDILPSCMLYKQKSFNSWAPFVDMWRLAYALKHGGVIMDLDFICLRPWTPSEHWGYREAGERVIFGLMNFPAKHQLMQDLLLMRLFPDCIEEQALWVQQYHADLFNAANKNKPWKERMIGKNYLYASSPCFYTGVKYYGLMDKTAELMCLRYFPSHVWKRLYDGSVHIDDPDLKKCPELHLHGHRIFSYGNQKMQQEAAPDSVFLKLWTKHFDYGED